MLGGMGGGMGGGDAGGMPDPSKMDPGELERLARQMGGAPGRHARAAGPWRRSGTFPGLPGQLPGLGKKK